MDNTFTTLDYDKLIDTFLIWFWNNKNKIEKDKNFLKKDKFGREMVSALKSVNHWKGKSRGNPKKGYDKMKEIEFKKDVKPPEDEFADF